MKGKNLFVIALLVLAAGLVLVFAYRSIHSQGLVTTGGILFILAGLFNIFYIQGERDGRKANGRSHGGGSMSMAFGWLTSAGAMILGLCMLIFSSTFVGLIPFIFGVLVAFMALYQFYLLAYGARPATLPGWLFIAPVLLVAAAVYLFMQRAGMGDEIIMLITGISLLFFGAVGILESILIGHANRRALTLAKEVETKPAHESAEDDADESATSHEAETGHSGKEA